MSCVGQVTAAVFDLDRSFNVRIALISNSWDLAV